MDQVSGIADERDPLGNERAGDKKSERMRSPPADYFDVAKMQLKTPLEFGVKRLVRQSHDALGIGLGFGPDDRGTAAFERQNSERAGGQKMLLGAAVVLALMLDIYDNCRLVVAPAMSGDAGATADTRSCPIGRNEKAGRKNTPITKLRLD